MAHVLQSLFEEIKPLQKRLKRPAKDEFLALAEKRLQQWGFETVRSERQGRLFHSINLETTTSEQPEYIIMAHYDTPTMIPFWIEPLVRVIGHTRPVFLSLSLIFIILLFSLLPGIITGLIAFLLLASLLLFFVPNPKNYNDNTSGVLGLLYLAKRIGTDKNLMGKIKLVLVDNEEMILTGSSFLREHWIENGFDYKESQIISLDCIGWGTIPVIVRNGYSPLADDLEAIFKAKDENTQLVNMGGIPINDNYNFRDAGAVLVTFMNPTVLWKGGYYIKNIHSPLDNDIDLPKIDWVTDRVMEQLSAKQA